MDIPRHGLTFKITKNQTVVRFNDGRVEFLEINGESTTCFYCGFTREKHVARCPSCGAYLCVKR